MSERSLPASAQTLARARREGDLPLSPLLLACSSLLIARLIAPRSFDALRSDFAVMWRAALDGVAPSRALSLAMEAMARLLPSLVLLAAVSVLVTLAQTRGAFRTEPPQGGRSTQGFTALAALICLTATLAITVMNAPRAGLDALIVGLGLTGVLDLAIRRWRWHHALRRSPAEARREARDHEGDPLARALRRREHLALLDETSVENDWLLVDDGRGTLIAVVWREGMDSPRVVLHARGPLAEEMRARAEAMGLAVHHRPELVNDLSDVAPGNSVPERAWDTLASLIAQGSPGARAPRP